MKEKINNYIRDNMVVNNIYSTGIDILAALYIILPIYLSFDISASFPSLTGSRVVLLICILLGILKKNKEPMIFTRSIKGVIIYAIILFFVNIFHVFSVFSDSIKTIFSIILEEMMLVYVICVLVDSKEKILRFIKIMVYSSAFITVIALIEFLSGVNLFYLLTTTSKEVYQAGYTRLGMTRAEASFGHSVYYAVYCACMIPFSIYLYEKYNKKIYFVIFLSNLVGVIISGARGQLVMTVLALIMMFLFKTKEEKRKYLKAFMPIMAIFIVILCLVPSVNTYVIENIKTILNVVGFDFEISSEYGTNVAGLDSRLIQLSGFVWLVKKNAIFWGLGSAPHIRGLVSYYWKTSGWQVVPSIDVGYMGWFLEFGLFGAIAQVLLFASIWSMSADTRNEEPQKLNEAFKWFIVIYLLNLCISTGLEKMLWIIIALIVSKDQIKRRNKVQ